MLVEEAEEATVKLPESSNPRDNLLVSGEEIQFAYSTGCLVCRGPGETEVSLSIICVAEVEERLLVAIPSAVWHRKVRNRLAPPDLLKKPVAILAASQSHDDPEAAGDQEIRLWLGLLATKYDEDISYGEEFEVQHLFGADSAGNVVVPFAQALVAAARDHFTFVTDSREWSERAASSRFECSSRWQCGGKTYSFGDRHCRNSTRHEKVAGPKFWKGNYGQSQSAALHQLYLQEWIQTCLNKHFKPESARRV